MYTPALSSRIRLSHSLNALHKPTIQKCSTREPMTIQVTEEIINPMPGLLVYPNPGPRSGSAKYAATFRLVATAFPEIDWWMISICPGVEFEMMASYLRPDTGSKIIKLFIIVRTRRGRPRDFEAVAIHEEVTRYAECGDVCAVIRGNGHVLVVERVKCILLLHGSMIVMRIALVVKKT